ncbi:MAG: hypothetical protein LCH41_13325 [Armatimonadetes bacterium]|nr:hypothetical protein [Armatimonadota bacterium]
MNKMMTRFATVLASVAMVGACWAPIGEKPADAQFHEELSQKEIARYQGSGTVQSTPTPVKEAEAAPKVNGSNNTNAAQVLAGASSQAAQATLKKAAKEQAPEEPKTSQFLLLAGLFLLIGFASAIGVKHYLNRVVPDAPKRKGKGSSKPGTTIGKKSAFRHDN